MRRFLGTALLAGMSVLALERSASAQEIQLTGPLAGAPAVRNLRLHRAGRVEIAPTASFTLLDEFNRTILVGGQLQYHFADWIGVGVWGAYGLVQMNTALSEEIDKVSKDRWDATRDDDARTKTDRNASMLSVGKDFPSQLGKIKWIASPQITLIPFRGKLSLFEGIFVDTDLHFFAGPALVGLEERDNYGVADFNDSQKTVLDAAGKPAKSFPMASRMAIAPTFGVGFSFFTSGWNGFALEYRAVPFAWNPSGFDSKGGPPDETGPDFKVDDKDRTFKFNQMLNVSLMFYLPGGIKSSP